jgi:hypothetical protein
MTGQEPRGFTNSKPLEVQEDKPLVVIQADKATCNALAPKRRSSGKESTTSSLWDIPQEMLAGLRGSKTNMVSPIRSLHVTLYL